MSAAIGPLNYSLEEGMQKSFSDETGTLIDTEIRKIIDGAYKKCKELLNEKKDLVTK